METKSILITVFSSVFGGGLAAYLTYKLGNRKQQEAEFVSVVKEYKELVMGYKNDVDNLRQEVKNLSLGMHEKEKEITQLRNQLMIFESSHSDVPIPIWLKDTSGKMLFVNPEYERALLQPINKSAKDYIGNTDVKVWGEKVSKQFREHDKKVMMLKKPIEFEETWTGTNGSKMKGKIIKYPRFLNNTVIGIGGVIVEKWRCDECLDRV